MTLDIIKIFVTNIRYLLQIFIEKLINQVIIVILFS